MLTVSLDCLSSSCILCAQCWQCLSIVYHHPVSCVPNVDSVSPLFFFILYLVYPMLTRCLLDCLSSSCILCAQCWHCLSSVYLHPVSCVPNVDIVSQLFIFILYLVHPMLTVSLDCLSSSCILCTQCWQCLSIVIFILYLVCPMLTLSLDCLSSSCILCAQCWQCPLDCLSSSCILCTQCWHCLSIVYLHPVSCVPNVDIVSRVFIYILYLVCPMLTVFLDCLSSSCILCTQCWQCLSIVYLHPVSCVPNVDSVSRVFIFILFLVSQCWHCLSMVCLHPVSCVPNVDSVSRLFVFILYLVYPMLTLSLDCLSSSCILCTQCWQCLSIVYLHLYLVSPMLTLSLDCLSSSCILCTQYWQHLSIVCLHPVSCVPNVDSVSRLFIFILYLVCPMLTLSLECLSSSCILCAQCWHCLSIVYLHPVSCVPNVDSVSRLFIFILYLVYPMLTVSLDCLSSSCILCTQCWHCLSIVYLHPVSCVPNVDKCLSIVYLHPVSCVPNVDIVSRLFIFILYLVYPMLTASLDCLSSSCILCTQCWRCLSIIYLHPVSCVPNVDIVSRVFIFILYLVCPMLTLSLDCLSSSCILCTQCWQCLSIVYLHPVSCVPNVWQCLSIVYLHPVSCVPNVDSVSRLFIFILYLVCPMLTLSLDCLSSSCILCTQCWQCLSIVYLHPVSCVPNVDSVSRVFIFICILCPNVDSVSRWFVFILYLVCPMLTVSLDCLSSSCILCSNVDIVSRVLSSSCILCAQCWHCLSIVYLHPVSCVPIVDSVSRLFVFILYLVYPMLTIVSPIVYLHPVSCVPNVDSVSRLFIFILYLVCVMLTVSLECLSSSCILCPQCWQCLSMVCLHPVSCVPNVDSVSRLFVFILYLVYPMLTLSLDCLSSSCILCTQCWQCPLDYFIFILYLVCPMLTLSLDYLSSSCILWPNVDIVSRLFIFILYLVYPMLTVSLGCLSSSCILCSPMLTLSLECLSSSCILCAQCWHCLSIVYLHPVSCVPNVDSVSRLFVFILYLVYPMLTLSLDCLSSSCILCTQCWQCLSIVYLHPVSCVPNVDSVSRCVYLHPVSCVPMLTVSLDGLSSSCILCAQCWQCLSIVCLNPVSCVPNVDIVSRLFSSSCILCTQCWQCLSIIYLHPVSCVPNVDIVSRLFIFILYLVYPMLTLSLDCLSSSCILCTPMLTLSLDCLSSSCILCAYVDSVSGVFIFILYLVSQCWQCLSIVYLHPVSCVPNVDSVSRLFIFHPVSCVPNVDSVSPLFFFILYLVYPMLTVSLDCLSSSCILCAQCWLCLSSVYLHPVSCVPNVDIVSRLFIFILYLVYRMLTVSLDCLSSSCILCTQCWQCLSIVYLHPVSCVPNVDIVSRLFIFILYLVCPMLTVSLDCLLHPVSCVPNVDSVSRLFIFILYLVCPMLTLSLECLSTSCILCAQCWQCLSIVYLHPVSCVPNVDSVSRLFIFILYLVCLMLIVSLECLSHPVSCVPCWHCLSMVCLHPVSCVPNVDSVSRLFVFILYLVYPMLTLSLDCLSSSCILCTQCWQCLSIVYLYPVSCVPNVDIVSRLFIFILYLVYPILTASLDCLSSSCILCTQRWQCLSIIYLHPVSCVPNVDIVSRVFIFILYLVCPMLTLSLDCLSSSCILCTQCWHCLSIVYLHPVSCVPNLTVSLDCLSSSCILCTQCWHCLSIVYLHPVSCVPNVDNVSRLFIFILYLVSRMLTLSLDCLSSSSILCTQCWQRLSIVCLHPVSCVPNVDGVSRLFIFILYLVCPMLTLSLECLSSSCILCAQCWHCLSIVYLHPVSCVPNVDSVSRLFIFILYLVYPMLTVSLDCLSSSCILCAQCWQCLSIVYLHPVSCVPNVDIVSRLFIFILYLVYPMLTVSLDCLSSSCILCA